MHKTLIVLLSAGMILGACAKQTFRIASTPGTVSEQVSSHFVLGGAFQKRDIDVAKICGGKAKVAGVETSYSPLNLLLGLLTLRLYMPKTYKVSCIR